MRFLNPIYLWLSALKLSGVLLFSSKCLIDVAISLEQTFGPLAREVAFIIASLGFLMVHKQQQNFSLSLKLLLEPRKAHVIPVVVFRDTFLFPRDERSDSGQRGSPGEHPPTGSGSSLLSAVVGSVLKTV